MQAIINASKINGVIQAPASKSSMQRACAAALLHKGTTYIHNSGIANDDKAALNVIAQMGAVFAYKNEILKISSEGYPNDNLPEKIELNFGESGLAVRMFTPIAALSSSTININGEGSLVKRPMNFFEEILPELGVTIQAQDGKLPIQIRGALLPKNISVDGSLSSQFLTGLLFAYANAVEETTIISVNNLKSRPYIDLTLAVMKHFGYNITNNNYRQFIIEPFKNKLSNKEIHYTVEGDWSGTAFILVAGAVTGSVCVKGLQLNSTQGDKSIMQALKDCGVKIVIENDEITITANELNAFKFDATECPDLFPPLAALAANCKGTTVIKGVSRLANKESNRGLTLQNIFGIMGIKIILDNDDMIITGGQILPAEVSSHHDHRIAMAAAIAGLNGHGIIINDAEAINKSYPAFYSDLTKIGAIVSLKN